MKQIKDILAKADKLKEKELISQELPQQGSWPASIHLFDRQSLLAIAAALGAQRPLLVRGEPGTGKSQLARAAAAMLKSHFISTVVQPHTEYQELLWTFDYTQRLADAQLMSLGGIAFNPTISKDKKSEPVQQQTLSKDKKSEPVQQQTLSKDKKSEADQQQTLSASEQLAPARYTCPGPLWYAYDWENATKQTCKTGYQPESPKDGNPPATLVLLIDEIDKADISLSNGLLEVLGNGSFSVPHFPSAIGNNNQPPPLVILTSNSIRELPNALLRRCVLLDLALPKDDALEAHLLKIGQAHFPEMKNSVLKLAAQQIRQDRDKQVSHHLKTGQAEFVDLLRALQQVADTAEQQQARIEELAPFFFKHPPQQA